MCNEAQSVHALSRITAYRLMQRALASSVTEKGCLITFRVKDQLPGAGLPVLRQVTDWLEIQRLVAHRGHGERKNWKIKLTYRVLDHYPMGTRPRKHSLVGRPEETTSFYPFPLSFPRASVPCATSSPAYSVSLAPCNQDANAQLLNFNCCF